MNDPQLPPIINFGRMIRNNQLLPILMEKEARPDLTRKTHCKCTTSKCLKKCSCQSASVPCYSGCLCLGEKEKCGRVISEESSSDSEYELE